MGTYGAAFVMPSAVTVVALFGSRPRDHLAPRRAPPGTPRARSTADPVPHISQRAAASVDDRGASGHRALLEER
jgi:hypothetical protein